MKKNEMKKGAGIFLLTGMICALYFLSCGQAYAQEKEDKVYDEVAVMPKFNDGDLETFRNWVVKNITYPDTAKKKGIKGTVYSEFIVEKDGSVKVVKISRSVDESLDNEVMRVIKASPKWTPGKDKDGKIVRVKFALPVNFALN